MTYFSFDKSFSLLIFLHLAKNEETPSTRNLNFLQIAPSNSFLFGSQFIIATVSNASWRVKLCKNVGWFRIIYATDPVLQNMFKTVCHHWLTFDIFNINLCIPCLITCANFFSKAEQFSTCFVSMTQSFCIFWHK